MRFVNTKTGDEITLEEAQKEYHTCTFLAASKKARSCYIDLRTNQILLPDEGKEMALKKENLGNIMLLQTLNDQEYTSQAMKLLAAHKKLDVLSPQQREKYGLLPAEQPRKPLTRLSAIKSTTRKPIIDPSSPPALPIVLEPQASTSILELESTLNPAPGLIANAALMVTCYWTDGDEQIAEEALKHLSVIPDICITGTLHSPEELLELEMDSISLDPKVGAGISYSFSSSFAPGATGYIPPQSPMTQVDSPLNMDYELNVSDNDMNVDYRY